MKSVDFLIVGGSAAGTTAAEVIRSQQSEASIAIVTDEPNEQYSRVLIPHYIRHKVERAQVFLKKPEWYTEKNIELIRGVRVSKLDSKKHTVLFANEEEVQYKKLLIAVGGNVIKLSIPGGELANILYMRTVEDADKIIEIAKKSKKAVIIGGGFIGLEFASCFKLNGVSEITTLVRDPYYWAGKLDEDSSKVLLDVLARNGIQVVTEEDTDYFEGTGVVQSVVTKKGSRYECDVVGMGIGIKPDLAWLNSSGVLVNRGIVTNEYLETSVPDVYAAGDCAEFKDVIFGRQHVLGNWANATSQGSVVGRNMAHSTSSGSTVETPLRHVHETERGFDGQGKTVFETASSYSITFFDGSCSFIGVTDVDYADEVVKRGSLSEGKVTRIFIKTIDNTTRIVGATVINDPSQVSPLTAAIKNKVNITPFENKLMDKGFDLKGITS